MITTGTAQMPCHPSATTTVPRRIPVDGVGVAVGTGVGVWVGVSVGAIEGLSVGADVGHGPGPGVDVGEDVGADCRGSVGIRGSEHAAAAASNNSSRADLVILMTPSVNARDWLRAEGKVFR
jgi:hypothetical protein